MKKVLILGFIFFCVILNAQAINVNPDKNGEPWILNPLRKPTPEDLRKLKELPKLELKRDLKGRELPQKVDNSTNQYFREFFNQSGGCCSHASSIAYIFTYEINNLRDIPSVGDENLYPTHYTWNFTNLGQAEGTWPLDAMFIAKANGVPSVAVYEDFDGSDVKWMSGYDKYFSGMQNKISDIYSLKVNTPEGIETLKNWFHDHNGKHAPGGLASFAASISTPTYTTAILGEDSDESGKKVVVTWGNENSIANHAMTFVGYNDSLKYDYNGDGQYTNDIDINGDGIVDVRDWEIGGVIVANSWGPNWGDDGKIYMMYKLLAEPILNGGIMYNQVLVMDTYEEYHPQLTAKVKLKYNSRHKISLKCGISENPESLVPDEVLSFPLFNYQGGDHFMQGGINPTAKEIELGLDLSPLLKPLQNRDGDYKVFLYLDEHDDDNSGFGIIENFSVIAYSAIDNQEMVFESAETNLPIKNNAATVVTVNVTTAPDSPMITATELTPASENSEYSYQFEATGGIAPTKWHRKMDYNASFRNIDAYPEFSGEALELEASQHGVSEYDLPFSFPFYNQRYDKIYITTNGLIYFDPNFMEAWEFNDILKSNKALAAFASKLDMIAAAGEGIFVEATENLFKIRFKASKIYSPEFKTDFSIYLYPSGTIEFYYGAEIANNMCFSSGVSNGDGNHLILDQAFSSDLKKMKKIVIIPNYDFIEGLTLTKDGNLSTPFSPRGLYDLGIICEDYNKLKDFKNYDFLVKSNESCPLITSFDTGNDYFVHRGENVKLDLVLKNFGEQNSENLNLSISSDSDLIEEITNANAQANSLAAGAEISLANAFEFKIKDNALNNALIPMKITINEGAISTSKIINLKVQAAELEINHTSGKMRCPSELPITLFVKNIGKVDLENIHLDFTNLSTYDIEAVSYNMVIAQIPVGETVEHTIYLAVTGYPEQGEMADFKIDFSTADGFSESYYGTLVFDYDLFNEGFESYLDSIPEDIWTIYDNDGDGKKWELGTNSNVAYKGKQYAKIKGNTSGANDDWLISQKLEVFDYFDLKFMARSQRTYSLSSMKILVSHTGTNIEDFTEVIADIEEVPGEWTEYSFYINSQYQDTYLAFQCNTTNKKALYLDNISIKNELAINEENIPTEVKLYQNYPNPFNPATTIKFYLPNDQKITLAIFNQKGEKISEIAHGLFKAGNHLVNFKALNLGSGIYFYKLTGDNFSKTNKMILIK